MARLVAAGPARRRLPGVADLTSYRDPTRDSANALVKLAWPPARSSATCGGRAGRRPTVGTWKFTTSNRTPPISHRKSTWTVTTRESPIVDQNQRSRHAPKPRALYALTEQLDAQIGRLLDALDHTGQAGHKMVALTSDHGEMVGAHRMWLKGWTYFPIQNVEKIRLRMSSAVVAPVMASMGRNAPYRSSSSISCGIADSTAARAFSRASADSRSNCS
jgi:hypothetical protein